MTNELWAKAWAKETKDIDLTVARVAGRATKANPNKEDAVWWNEQGPLWVDQYIQWRKANQLSQITVFPHRLQVCWAMGRARRDDEDINASTSEAR